MSGIFTYIWVIYGANVGKSSIHGAYGIWFNPKKKGGHFMGFNHIDPSEIGGDAV
jgi:hypothetical protein